MNLEPTKEQKIKEIKRCGLDPIYFLKTYGRIAHPERGTIPFSLYPFQEKCIQEFKTNRYNIVLKARQIGLSWTVAGYIAWLINFYRDKTILCVATKERTAANVIRKVKKILKNLPSWLFLSDIVSDNLSGIELKNGSWARASATSSDVGVSESLSLLVIDEAALVFGMEELWTGLAPTLTVGGSCIAISTPRGIGNWFSNIYQGAINGENNFNAMKIMWDEHPDRDQQWFDNETKNLSKRQIAQEYCCNFNTSGDTYVDAEDIEWAESHVSKPISKMGFERKLWIWEEPVFGEEYIVAVDTSSGTGEDETAIEVFKKSSLVQVAEFCGKSKDNMTKETIYSLAKKYNDAIVSIEVKATGPAIINGLIEDPDKKYKNIFCMMKGNYRYVPFHQSIGNESSVVQGFLNIVGTRDLLLSMMEEAMRLKKVVIRSERLISQIKTFTNHSDKPRASKGARDDLVLAFAQAIWVFNATSTHNARMANANKILLANASMSRIELDTKIAGQIGYKPNPVALMKEMANLRWSTMAFKG